MVLSNQEIARIIDLSCVRADSTYSEIANSVGLAKKYNCICVFAMPAHTPYVIEELKNCDDIMAGGVIGFPSGSSATEIKVFEARNLIAMGVNELDMVINITWLRSRKYDLVKKDIQSVREAAGKLPLKLILECDYLSDEEIVTGAEIGIEAGVDWIKSGTGWAPNGTTLKQIELMVRTARGRCLVKAAGGVKDRETLLAMYDLGVRRFGVGVRTAEMILSDVKSDSSNIIERY